MRCSQINWIQSESIQIWMSISLMERCREVYLHIERGRFKSVHSTYTLKTFYSFSSSRPSQVRARIIIGYKISKRFEIKFVHPSFSPPSAPFSPSTGSRRPGLPSWALWAASRFPFLSSTIQAASRFILGLSVFLSSYKPTSSPLFFKPQIFFIAPKPGGRPPQAYTSPKLLCPPQAIQAKLPACGKLRQMVVVEFPTR